MFTRQPNTEYILSLSYGKDSLACLEAIKQLGYPLDRIVHAEVWATDTIHADLPPMVEFKKHADQIILDRYGIEVEHIYAMINGQEKVTYEKIFYRRMFSKKYNKECIYGFPITRGAWCNWRLKMKVLANIEPKTRGNRIVQYLGIASDEPERIARHTKPDIILPLVMINWNEEYCRDWCEQNGLLSPIYTTAERGGCWFCHNQGVDQLRLLRQNYPDLWELLLKWDNDSHIPFKPTGYTVHDFDKRFYMEDIGLLIPDDTKFRWKQVKQFQIEGAINEDYTQSRH